MSVTRRRDFTTGTQENYAAYLPRVHRPEPVESDGFVQPYTDSPLDDETVGETVYMNLINKAKRYVYITTPYLIISNEMITALTTAAKSGLDVRIITPHIPDKWYVHALTRAWITAAFTSTLSAPPGCTGAAASRRCGRIFSRPRPKARRSPWSRASRSPLSPAWCAACCASLHPLCSSRLV